MFASRVIKIVPHSSTREQAIAAAARLRLGNVTIRADKATSLKVARQTAERYTRLTGFRWTVEGGLR